MTDNVSEFACGVQYRDELAWCARKRWHAGNHRAELEGSLAEWPDPPAPAAEPLPELALLRPRAEPAVLEDAPQEAEPELVTLHPATWAPSAAWAVFALLVTLWPALLVLAYRAAF